MSITDDLITIVDFCNEMATSIRGDWSDPLSECRTIWDAHDIAHVLTGGDRKIADWSHARAFSNGDDEDDRFSASWPDVRRRMAEVIKRATTASND